MLMGMRLQGKCNAKRLPEARRLNDDRKPAKQTKQQQTRNYRNVQIFLYTRNLQYRPSAELVNLRWRAGI